VAWNYLSRVRPFSKVDDALGVVYTHGIAGFTGGMLLGIFGDPNMIQYGCGHLDAAGQVVNTSQSAYVAAHGVCVPFSVAGLMYTGSAHQLWEQFRAALFVLFWSALVTYILMKLISLVLRGARYSDEILEVGDMAIHDEEAFPEGVSPEEAEIMEEALVMAGIGEGTPPDPGLAPSTHPEPPHSAREP
jgi:Amt family ammonium transporter